MTHRIGDTDLTVEEIASVLASIAGVEASEISGWVIGLELHSHAPGECHLRTAVVSSASTLEHDDHASELRLLAGMLDGLADRL